MLKVLLQFTISAFSLTSLNSFLVFDRRHAVNPPTSMK